MKIKKGVILAGLRMEMRAVLIVADRIWSINGKELVVTSGLDSAHTAGSLHYYGYAVDLRTRYFDKRKIDKVVFELNEALDENYDVILHSNHIHVEYDVLRVRGERI